MSVTTGQPGDGRNMNTFTRIWLGQLGSLVGSGLTGFALGIWVYLQTGSITSFALILVAATLPNVLLSPVAGAIVDRRSRRKVMLLSDTGAALGTLSLVSLLLLGRLEVWHIYVVTFVGATCSTFHRISFLASVSQLVPKEELGRANGMLELSLAAQQLLSPVLAGVLLGIIGLAGLLIFDLITYCIAVSILLFSHIPQPRAAGEQAQPGTFLREALQGWVYIRERSGLLAMLVFFAVFTFVTEVAYVLFTPMALSFTSVTMLGIMLSVAGVGYGVGSAVMSVWRGPRRRVDLMVGAALLFGIFAALMGLRPSVPLVMAAGALVFFCYPIIVSSSQVIWMQKVEPHLHGRVFAFRQMIVSASQPFAYLIAAPLAEQIFEPLLQPGGGLAGSIGAIIGTGEGRGIGLLFIVMGLLAVLVAALSYLYPRLRRIEEELPDVGTAEEPAPLESGAAVRASASQSAAGQRPAEA